MKKDDLTVDLGELGKVVIEEIELADVEVFSQMLDGGIGGGGGFGGIGGPQPITVIDITP